MSVHSRFTLGGGDSINEAVLYSQEVKAGHCIRDSSRGSLTVQDNLDERLYLLLVEA